jgi:hypothetical protein
MVISYLTGKTDAKAEADEKYFGVLKTQIDSSQVKETKYKKMLDSVQLLNQLLLVENKVTKRNINQILKANENKKSNLLFISDSTKLRIIDSMLRANGFR